MNNSDIYLYEKKLHKYADYTVWLAFPGVNSFAMSSLGFLWIYKSIDEIDDVNIEILSSDLKTTKFMYENVDLIGFSFTFDTDFLTIFSMVFMYSYICFLHFKFRFSFPHSCESKIVIKSSYFTTIFI